MNPFTEPVTVSHFLAVGAVLFVCGAVCMATKRNAIGVLLGIELVLNGANLNFSDSADKSILRQNVDYYNNTPMPGYKPYTYPHPLTGLAPPTNLTIASP